MQTHRQEYGNFHQRNIQATGQNYRVSALIPLKPERSENHMVSVSEKLH
jgi:hypothetical protein